MPCTHSLYHDERQPVTPLKKPGLTAACAHMCGCRAYVWAYLSMHTNSWIFVLVSSSKIEKEKRFYFLFIETEGRMNDETFTDPAITYTQEQGLFDKMHRYKHNTCFFEAQNMTSVGRKLACSFGVFVLFEMNGLCCFKLLRRFCRMFLALHLGSSLPRLLHKVTIS